MFAVAPALHLTMCTLFYHICCRIEFLANVCCHVAGAANNVIHPEPRHARRDALMRHDHISSPTYRRAAVTSSPRDWPLAALQAQHPRVAELQRQASGSSQASGLSQVPLLSNRLTSASPVSSESGLIGIPVQPSSTSFQPRKLERRVSN